MGLDTSHDCWHGGYGGFMQFRKNLAAAIGIDLMKMDGFVENGIPWPSKHDEPLAILLSHSDCDGDIAIEDLLPLANRLDEVAALVEAGPPPDDRSGFTMTKAGDGLVIERHGGHLARNGGTAAAARTFAAGCRNAAELGERVEFH